MLPLHRVLWQNKFGKHNVCVFRCCMYLKYNQWLFTQLRKIICIAYSSGLHVVVAESFMLNSYTKFRCQVPRFIQSSLLRVDVWQLCFNRQIVQQFSLLNAESKNYALYFIFCLYRRTVTISVLIINISHNIYIYTIIYKGDLLCSP